jgi:hypothetical protein
MTTLGVMRFRNPHTECEDYTGVMDFQQFPHAEREGYTGVVQWSCAIVGNATIGLCLQPISARVADCVRRPHCEFPDARRIVDALH